MTIQQNKYNEPTETLVVIVPKRIKDALRRNAQSDNSITRQTNNALEAYLIQHDLGMTDDQRNCDGFNRSNCCDASIDLDIGLCGKCRDHAETQCADCEDKQGCENYATVN